MDNSAVELLGFSLSLLGLVGTLITTLLPHWWRTAHAGPSVVTAASHTKGLWMDCVWHSTGVFQCRGHRSQLALPPDLRAARAMMVMSCCLSALACGAAVPGMRCTRCAEGTAAKASAAVSGGTVFIVAGLLCLAPVAWSTNEVVRDFYSPALPGGVRYELGQALYLGFASALLTVLGGALLCAPNRRRGHEAGSLRPAPSSGAPEGDHGSAPAAAAHCGYRRSDYV